MTVQELTDILSQIENKKRRVFLNTSAGILEVKGLLMEPEYVYSSEETPPAPEDEPSLWLVLDCAKM